MPNNHSLSLLAVAVLAAGGTAVAVGAGGSSGPSEAERAQLLQAKKDRATPPRGDQGARSSSTLKRECPDDMPANVTALWRFKPKSMAEVRAKADTTVLADVVSVEQAQDDVLRSPGEPGGEIRTPQQVVRLKVRQAYKGPSARGDTITVSKLGGDCYRVEEDPAYAKGETHLLMLERAPRGHLQTVSPEGRFEQTDDGRLKPAGHSAVAESARGKRADDVVR